MPERFSEDDARRIFARAAERQHADDQKPTGLSLAELQEIGRAAGLDPEHVVAAVAEVQGGEGLGAAPPATFLGVNVEPSATRVIPGPLTDEMWGRMVSRVRSVFNTVGVTSDVGATREWQGTNTQGGLSNLRMTASPTEGGTLVSLRTSRAGQVSQYRALFGVFAAMVVFFLVLGLATGDVGDPGFWAFVSMFAAATVGIPLAGRFGSRRWAETRQSQFDALLDRFELMAREGTVEAAPPSIAPLEARQEPARAGRLDLDGDLPEPDADPPARRRTRAGR